MKHVWSSRLTYWMRCLGSALFGLCSSLLDDELEELSEELLELLLEELLDELLLDELLLDELLELLESKEKSLCHLNCLRPASCSLMMLP